MELTIRARQVMGELYRPLYLNQAPILYNGRRTAELIKYAANAFLAAKITFINELPTYARRLVPICRRLRGASDSTTGLERSSYTQVLGSVVPVSRRIFER